MKEYSERVIGAFLSNYKVKDIAAAAGLSVSSVNRYKHDPAFVAILNERRAAIVGAAVDRMNESILNDVDVLQSVIDDEKVNPAVRVNAVNVKWVHLREWKALIDFETRLRALERTNLGDSARFRPGGGTW